MPVTVKTRPFSPFDFSRDVVIIVATMEIEWDEKKNKENIRKHGFDFVDAHQIFHHPLFVRQDNREDYGEDRYIGIGMMSNGTVVVCVFTERDREQIRMISLRKATRTECAKYEKAIENELGKG